MSGGLCARPYSTHATSATCERPHGHAGQHWARNGAMRWGERGGAKGTYEKAVPLPAGSQLAPYRPPPAPSAARFSDIPGQAAMDFSRDDPDALCDPETGEPA